MITVFVELTIRQLNCLFRSNQEMFTTDLPGNLRQIIKMVHGMRIKIVYEPIKS